MAGNPDNDTQTHTSQQSEAMRKEHFEGCSGFSVARRELQKKQERGGSNKKSDVGSSTRTTMTFSRGKWLLSKLPLIKATHCCRSVFLLLVNILKLSLICTFGIDFRTSIRSFYFNNLLRAYQPLRPLLHRLEVPSCRSGLEYWPSL